MTEMLLILIVLLLLVSESPRCWPWLKPGESEPQPSPIKEPKDEEPIDRE